MLPLGIDRLGANPVLLRHLRHRPLIGRAEEHATKGGTVTVCDRQTPIAQLVPVGGDVGGLEVREPTAASALPAAPRITLKKGVDIVALLRADRDDR